MAESDKLRIVVVGAGIAGLATTIALQKHPGIDIQIYERASELREVGASIALGPNGMRTLDKLGIHNALDDSIAIRNSSGLPMIYRHWKTNEIISVDAHRSPVEYRHQTARYYRAHLQEALLKHVSASRIHLSKSFLSTESSKTGSLSVRFSDGTVVEADLLIGADGINSAVRTFFVPSSVPKWTGWTAFRSVFPEKLLNGAQEELQDETNHWWGSDRTFFAGRLGKGLFTIVGGFDSNPDAPDAPYGDSALQHWNTDGDLGTLKKLYRDWNATVRRMIEASPYTKLYPNTFASAIDTWTYGGGLVSLVGDAAHAHGGAFATGGSLALNDAYAFSLAIRHIFPEHSPKPSKETITDALRLYEKTRKPHTDRLRAVVLAGYEKTTARIGKKETDEELLRRMRGRSDPFWMHEHDVEAAFLKVLGTGDKKESNRASL